MSFLPQETHFNLEKEKEITISLKQNDDSIIQLNLEDYIIGVVAAEMPALYEEEALKAQAIASRSYAMNKVLNNKGNNYDLVVGVNNQAYITTEEMRNKWGQNYLLYFDKIKNAVMATKGLVIKNNGEIIAAYYFAISNGQTEDSKTVFGSSKDYLVSVDSSEDKNVKNYEVTTIYSYDDFCEALNIACDDLRITDILRSNTNHVSKITINNTVYTGVELRKILNLRSTDFDIELKGDIRITTRGYGHGVGMSQSGANELAKSGYNFEAILKHYYQNITISNI